MKRSAAPLTTAVPRLWPTRMMRDGGMLASWMAHYFKLSSVRPSLGQRWLCVGDTCVDECKGILEEGLFAGQYRVRKCEAAVADGHNMMIRNGCDGSVNIWACVLSDMAGVLCMIGFPVRSAKNEQGVETCGDIYAVDYIIYVLVMLLSNYACSGY